MLNGGSNYLGAKKKMTTADKSELTQLNMALEMANATIKAQYDRIKELEEEKLGLQKKLNSRKNRYAEAKSTR